VFKENFSRKIFWSCPRVLNNSKIFLSFLLLELDTCIEQLQNILREKKYEIQLAELAELAEFRFSHR